MVVRVAHLTSVHNPFDTRIFLKECRTLAREGFDVALIAPIEQDTTRDGVRLLAIPPVMNRRTRMLRSPVAVLRRALRERADLYHFHDPELIPVALLLRILGRHVVYDVHEDMPSEILDKEWIPAYVRRPVSAGTRALEKLAARASDFVVTATPAIAGHFPREKTVIIQNFPYLDELSPLRGAPHGDREPLVVYVGDITEVRGLTAMLDATGGLPPELRARFVLAGSFSPPTLAESVRRHPARDLVTCPGWITRDELRRLLQRARVGLVVFHATRNHLESQPNKLFEYMAAGLPVVASNFPRWAELVEGVGCGLLVDPDAPDEIAEAIAHLLRHPDEAEEMGRRGRAAVVSTFNWERESATLLAAYSRIA